MSIDLAVLKSELQNDPQGVGYADLIDNDQAIADALNLARPEAKHSIYRGVIDTWEVVAATDAAEWAALSAQEKQRYQTIISAACVDTSSQNLRDAFNAMFGGGSKTRANLATILKRSGSRAEALFGQNVTTSDVANAKRS